MHLKMVFKCLKLFSFVDILIQGWALGYYSHPSFVKTLTNVSTNSIFLSAMQLSAIVQPGVMIVISPLLSLIQDQIITLNLKFGIPATFLNSQQTQSQTAAVLRELRHGFTCVSSYPLICSSKLWTLLIDFQENISWAWLVIYFLSLPQKKTCFMVITWLMVHNMHTHASPYHACVVRIAYCSFSRSHLVSCGTRQKEFACFKYVQVWQAWKIALANKVEMGRPTLLPLLVFCPHLPHTFSFRYEVNRECLETYTCFQLRLTLLT